MDDLITWLRAQLDDDERIALAAADQFGGQGGQHWAVNPERPEVVSAPTVGHGRGVFAVVYPATTNWGEPVELEHVARHDPARVLADIAAKRRILAAHEKWCDGYCEAGFDAAHMWSIKALASAYDARPGYREEWRPNA